MWEVLLGTAAANKAASIGIGLSVLVGGAGAAEVTGVGPAVREIVIPQVAQIQEADANEEIETVVELAVEVEETDLGALDAVESEATVLEEETENADDPTDDRQQFKSTDEDAPGNLVWRLRGGEFNLRGVLVDDGGLAIRTAGPDGETVDLPVDPALVTARIPGANGNSGKSDSEATIEDYVGYLVRASGECTVAETEDVEATCTVNELHILGSAGQSIDQSDIDEDSADALDVDAAAADDGTVDDETEVETDEVETDEGESADSKSDKNGRGKPERAGGPKQDKPSES